jgi:hypothetical protein
MCGYMESRELELVINEKVSEKADGQGSTSHASLGGGMKLDNELEGNNKRECHIPEAWAPKESR